MLEHHNIQFTRADNLNDEYDCNFEILNAPQVIVSELNQLLQFGVCSLSTSPNNSTLWSDRYAGSSGLCIELDTKILTDYLCSNYIAQLPFIVKYKKDFKNILDKETFKNLSNVDAITDFFRIKDYEEWHKEEEIRFVSLDILKDEHKQYQLPKECFKAIYVGSKVDETKIQNLKSVVLEAGIDVEIKKCK